MTNRSRVLTTTVILAVVSSVGALAGITIGEKPASLVAKNLQMVSGRAFLPLSDLATALGGTLKCTPDNSKCDITTGPTGVLKFDRGALASFSSARRGTNVRDTTQDLSKGMRAGVMNIQVTIDGSDVGVRREEEEEHLLLRPTPLMPLELVGRLLGGHAVYDPGTRAWKLPAGGPGCPLSFR